ncbi:MAG: hypothetical protein WCA77_05435 [Thermoplasmata archaeon]
MLALDLPSFATALLITIVEMTEVVALVFALSGDHASVRTGALGATAGTAVVAFLALGFSAAIVAFPRDLLLWAAAVTLAAFGVFLLRSTLRSYRRARASTSGATPRPLSEHSLQFAGGFTVGAVESFETVVVLIALAAAGYGFSALVGALVGGAFLVGLALVLHDQVRRIKVPTLKWLGTSLLFAYAVFWAGEAAGVAWPGGDLFLLVLVLAALAVVRGAIEMRAPRVIPVDTKG